MENKIEIGSWVITSRGLYGVLKYIHENKHYIDIGNKTIEIKEGQYAKASDGIRLQIHYCNISNETKKDILFIKRNELIFSENNTFENYIISALKVAKNELITKLIKIIVL